jgi:hypothetical protein
MNTRPNIARDYAALASCYSPVCLEVRKSMDRISDAFRAAFPGASHAHELLFIREWASLASVPSSLLENFKFHGRMCDQDGSRVIRTSDAMLSRLADVQAGTSPSPIWAQGHRDVSGGPMPSHGG